MNPIHVESFGAGPPLVLLHGWAMHSGLFAPIAPRLAERFRVILVDLPGHGRSAPPSSYTLEALAAAVGSATERAAPPSEPLSVLGWSLGGSVALHWALTAPARLERLILVATTPCFVARADWPHAISATTLRRFGDELAVSYRLTLQRFVALQVKGSDHAREVLAALHGPLSAAEEPSRDTLRKTLLLLKRTDLRSVVGAVRQRAVVIAGERDTLVPPAACRWLADALPHASFRSIAAAGHAPFLSHPQTFLSAVSDGN